MHDEFHVSKLLGKAVDKERCAEAKKLAAEGDDSLKNTCFWWPYGQATLPVKDAVNFERLGSEQPADLPSLVEQGKLRWIFASAGSRARSIFFRSLACQRLPQQAQPGQMRRPHAQRALAPDCSPTSPTPSPTPWLKDSTVKSKPSSTPPATSDPSPPNCIRILFHCRRLDMSPLLSHGYSRGNSRRAFLSSRDSGSRRKS